MSNRVFLNNNEFEDTETTLDPIYGSIKISPFEMRLINTPEFQRLRRIKQLGFVNLVYPAAEHSRFVHSIGVCFQAKKLVDQINENFQREKRYRCWRENGSFSNEAIVPTLAQIQITNVEKIIISAAALLHDLPHSPFSHEIESPNSDPSNGILAHDAFDKNPVLFKYLFDTKHSRLAEIIEIYNEEFWQLLREDEKWFQKIRDEFTKCDLKFSDDGFIAVNENSIINEQNNAYFKKLPILGVMIFEIHLFEKPKHWVTSSKDEFTNASPLHVKTQWDIKDNAELEWKLIPGWFRPYRKDIIGNTICADLIDYIERDGKHTGIISSIDLKFLDRMTISRAIPENEKATDLKVSWDKIPEYCEHIIFDIYDHKRGFIRESVITEILSCLQARYQLTERVYNHRVVEGARSMLQEISKLLCNAGILNIEILHTCKSAGANAPTGDDTFLDWVIDEEQRIKGHPNKVKEIKAAAKLAAFLKERRIYREAVIIDGIHGYISGSLSGGDSNCIALDDVLLSNGGKIAARRNEMLETISSQLSDEYNKATSDELDTNILVTIGARKFGKKYKVPRVLVAKPFSNKDSDNKRIDIQPLFACQDPPHIKIQLDAMKTAYNSLWRVYLFIHPAFHWDKIIKRDTDEKVFAGLHKKVEGIFLDFVNKETPIEWKNSIDFKQLLPARPVDYVEFINFYSPANKDVAPIKEDVEFEAVIKKLLVEIFESSPQDSLKPIVLTEKDHKTFLKLVSSDNEMTDYVRDQENTNLLLEKFSSSPVLNTRKNNFIKNAYQTLKNILNDQKQKELF